MIAAPAAPDPLTIVCQRLRSADPEIWDLFLIAFEEYAQRVTATVITAPPESLVRTQGQAQQCLALLRLFREAHLKTNQRPAK